MVLRALLLLVSAQLVPRAEPGAPQPERQTAEPAPGAAPDQAVAPAPEPAARWRLLGELELSPRGIFVVNFAHNSGTLYPGSFALFAYPPDISGSQFYISPQNTVLGFKLSGLSLGDAKISGALDVNLRSSNILTAAQIAPQFYDVHIQLETGWFRAFVGQFPDVLLPFVPNTVNSFPGGTLPGAIGYARPQVRADFRVPIRDFYQLLLQGSLNRPIQTFELSTEIAGRQAGLPDIQGRVAFAVAPESWRGSGPSSSASPDTLGVGA